MSDAAGISGSGGTAREAERRHRWRNFRKYLTIVRELAIADFRLKYHDSALGYVWSMLNPLMMFGVYYFVFHYIFKSSIQNFPLFLLIGVINFAFFQDCTFSGMMSLGAKAGIIKKIYFPRSIVVFTAATTSVISYLVNSSVIFSLVFLTKGFTPLVLLTIIPAICLLLCSIGISFLLTTLYAFFRDMGQIWNVLIMALFWMSPVAYNAETLPAPISTIVYFNPLSRIFVLMRHYLLYNYFDGRFLLMTVIYSVLVFIAGILVFRKYENIIPELF